MWRRTTLADAAVEGFSAAYGNTGFMGFPLALAVLGPGAATPTLIATILTVCILFAITVGLIEIGSRRELRPAELVGKVARALVLNPILIAPVIGAIFLMGAVDPPAPIETFVKLLGAAATPCALVTLGVVLGQGHPGSERTSALAITLASLKLVVHPALTWVLATYVFRLSQPLTHAAVLLAALPTGAGPFMVAQAYERRALLTSRVVLISTVASLVTITALISAAL